MSRAKRHPIGEERLSAHHPEWWATRLGWLEKNLDATMIEPRPGYPSYGFLSEEYLDGLRRNLSQAEDPGAVVVGCVGDCGLEALRPGEVEATWRVEPRPSILEDARTARILIWQAIDRYYDDARRGTGPERARARKFFQSLAATLQGDLRGRSAERPLDRTHVRLVYWKALFTLLHALRALKEWPWGGSRWERIDAICEAYIIPRAFLEDYMKLDDEGRPIGFTVSAPELARIWTAKKFDISQNRVANIMSTRPARPPRRSSKSAVNR